MLAAANVTGEAPPIAPKRIWEFPRAACPNAPLAAVKFTVAPEERVRVLTVSVAFPRAFPRLAVSVSAPPERLSVPMVVAEAAPG